jgi:hypothetical protein
MKFEQLQEVMDCGLVHDRLDDSYLICQFSDTEGRTVTAQIEVLSSRVKILPSDNCESWDLPQIKHKEF